MKDIKNKCTLCGEGIEELELIYDRSPDTFRKGWMCYYCWQVAYNDLDLEEKDRYLQFE